MQYQITAAIARADHTVTVTWSDGISATVSFAPYLGKGGVFAALKDTRNISWGKCGCCPEASALHGPMKLIFRQTACGGMLSPLNRNGESSARLASPRRCL